MPCPPSHTINHNLPSKSYHITCPPGHIIFHAMPVMTYHIPYHAGRTIPYTMLWPPDHFVYCAMPARSYHIPCYARQTIPYSIQCQPGHTKYHMPYSRNLVIGPSAGVNHFFYKLDREILLYQYITFAKLNKFLLCERFLKVESLIFYIFVYDVA